MPTQIKGNDTSTFGGPIISTAPAFSAYASSSQSISSGVWTKVLFDTEEFDANNNFSSSRFMPTVAGYYQINVLLRQSNSGSLVQFAVNLYKNGNENRIGTNSRETASGATQITLSSLVYCNGSTDYIEIYGYLNATSPEFNVSTAPYYSYFNGFLARAV